MNRVITVQQNTTNIESVDLQPQTEQVVPSQPDVGNDSTPSENDDDTLSYFSKLADEE